MAFSNASSRQYRPPNAKSKSRSRKWFITVGIALLILIALAIGLGVGLSLRKNEPSTPTTPTGNGTWWKPSKGMTWQIILNNASIGTNFDPVQIYDIDLFDNPKSTISALHASGKKVICYFSAGSHEDWRPDASQFPSSAMGSKLDKWPGENWINTNDATVRALMTRRMDMAVQKGCDAVDPDNIDAYDNDNGLGLTTVDAINYVHFLTTEAHSRGLACSLKNGGAIVPSVLSMTDFEVNEQCVQYNECNLYSGYIHEDKPVFHIEYTKDTSMSLAGMQMVCNGGNATGFSTIIKHLSLDGFYGMC